MGKNINYGRVILGGIVAGIVGEVLGFVVDGCCSRRSGPPA